MVFKNIINLPINFCILRHFISNKILYRIINYNELWKTIHFTFDYPKNRLPGWDKGSIAYHADDGKVFIGCGVGEKFGPKCHKGDTMGCGISFPVHQRSKNISLEESRRSSNSKNGKSSEDGKYVEVFFTKNGTMVGVRRVMLPFGGFLPSIGMLSFHEKVKVNLKPLTG